MRLLHDPVWWISSRSIMASGHATFYRQSGKAMHQNIEPMLNWNFCTLSTDCLFSGTP